MTKLQKFFYPNGAIRIITDNVRLAEIGKSIPKGSIPKGSIYPIDHEYAEFIFVKLEGRNAKALLQEENVVWERVP